MGKRYELQSRVFWTFCGAILTTVGSIVLHRQLLLSYVTESVHKELALVEGTVGYAGLTEPVRLSFKAYIFNVTNPDGVMRGDPPIFSECGPYVYDEILERHVLEMDAETDEIIYISKKQYYFNKEKSGNVTQNEKVTILNPAYLGSINTLAQLPTSFMKQYGDDISKLFPNQKTIFVTGKAGDILFKGLKLTCNPTKYVELELICKTLKSQKPPIVKDTDREGVYLYSLFDQWNGTIQGPFNVNRGLKNITLLGVAQAIKGKRVQKIWNSESCNTVRGSVDGTIWPPILNPPLPFASIFSTDLCRIIDADFEEKVTINGLTGYRFVMTERTWQPDEVECYCPLASKKVECLPTGLLDITACQEVPIILSEPHFLHGDPKLIQYARGLKPVKENHATFLVIEPRTGVPLSGQKRTQLNMKLSKQPVKLLANVSEGYFPLVWCESGSTLELSLIAHSYQIQRLLQLVWFLQFIPLVVGIYILLANLFLHARPKYKHRNIDPTVRSIQLSPNTRESNLTRRPLRVPRRMF